MSKRITFRSTNVRFPGTCMVCQQPANDTYKVTRTFTYGNRSVTITMPMPLCPSHYQTASFKSAAEQTVGRIGLIAGIIIGIIAAAGLMMYWINSNQGAIILNLLLALIFGAGMFLIVWAAVSLGIAPAFAAKDSKTIRTAIKILKYWPGSKEVQLEFSNDQAAQVISQVNKEAVLSVE